MLKFGICASLIRVLIVYNEVASSLMLGVTLENSLTEIFLLTEWHFLNATTVFNMIPLMLLKTTTRFTCLALFSYNCFLTWVLNMKNVVGS